MKQKSKQEIEKQIADAEAARVERDRADEHAGHATKHNERAKAREEFWRKHWEEIPRIERTAAQPSDENERVTPEPAITDVIVGDHE